MPRRNDRAGRRVQHVHAQLGRRGIVRAEGVQATVGPEGERHIHERVREP